MKLRIALLSVLFLLLTGAALAVPTAGEAQDSDAAAFLAAWDINSVARSDSYALDARTSGPRPAELAIYNPCSCVPWPSPGPTFPCPNPSPPGGPTIFFPFPRPNLCPAPWPL